MYEKVVDIFCENDISYSRESVNKIIDSWRENKQPLIDILSKHPNWNPEKYYISFDSDWTREIDSNVIINFCSWVKKKSSEAYNNCFSLLTERCTYVSERVEKLCKKELPGVNIAKGMKTSKAVRRALLSFGFIEDTEFLHEYARYSDAINPLSVTRHTVISVNLIDYLLMSNGTKWSSCHTLDKNNSKGHSGIYCSGTLSYALDSSSIVFYQVDRQYDGKDLELEPKIIRQMFHYSDGKLVQGRLYPQGNDGSTAEYTNIRAIMQEIIATCVAESNLWKVFKGTCECENYTCSKGTHYRDYLYSENCNVSSLLTMENVKKVKIGHDPICPVCGDEHEETNSLNCFMCRTDYICESCGMPIDEEDVYWINNGAYCSKCVTYCEDCQQYHLNEEVRYYPELERDVCNSCIENYCECSLCGNYSREEDAYVDAHGDYYCETCGIEHLVYVKGSYYPGEEVKICENCHGDFIGEGTLCPECKEELSEEN